MVRWTSEARRVDTVNVTRRVLLDVVPGLCFFLAANYQTSAREAKLAPTSGSRMKLSSLFFQIFYLNVHEPNCWVVCLLD
jgi:hypothetical protein